MAQTDIGETVGVIERYIEDVLKEDLRLLHLKLQHVNSELTDLIQQQHSLKVITNKSVHPNGIKTQVNIGCNFFMEASVTDTSKLLMNIGLNNYLEFTIEEALKYLEARIKVFEHKSDEICGKAVETKAHIKLMLLGIGELQNQRTPGNI